VCVYVCVCVCVYPARGMTGSSLDEVRGIDAPSEVALYE
jgi:hypothetical protein